MKKQYEVRWSPEGDERATLRVEIDHDVLTISRMHEVNNFWSGNDARLAAADGDILTVILKMTARQIWLLSLDVLDPVREFFGSEGYGGLEGMTITYWGVHEVFPDDEISWSPIP